MNLNKARALSDLHVKIFADGADKASMLALYQNPLIRGFTTNPTLMRKAGVTDYRAFAKDVLAIIKNLPVSFEVLADDFSEMQRQAFEIASWASNVVVKIPITNTQGEFSDLLFWHLTHSKMQINVTGITTLDQIDDAVDALEGCAHGMISVFAGRIADTGKDPVPIMATAVKILEPYPNLELIWASPRELLNIFQADAVGCHIITVTPDILKRLDWVGRDLTELSLETVCMFASDAREAGYQL